MGASAGAGGVVVQYEKVRAKWPVAEVNLIEDATPVVPNPADPLKNIITWQAFLPGCDGAALTSARSVASEGSRTGRHSPSTTGTRKFRSAPANRTASATSAGATTASVLEGEGDGPYPEWFGPSAPFLPEDSGMTSARTSKARTSRTVGSFDSVGTVPTGSCTTLQETRLYNRRFDSTFRYAILTFAWDNVLNPYGRDEIGYAAFKDEIYADTAAIENADTSAPTRHLYINNTDLFNTDGSICGRHVVTNFNWVTFSNSGTDLKDTIQKAHFNFIGAMLTGPVGWASKVIGLASAGCPASVSDGLYMSF